MVGVGARKTPIVGEALQPLQRVQKWQYQ